MKCKEIEQKIRSYSLLPDDSTIHNKALQSNKLYKR